MDTIRKEVAGHMLFRKYLPTSVEWPFPDERVVELLLTDECVGILNIAAEEANLNHRQVEIEHVFLGILREEKSFAALLLQAHAVESPEIRRRIAEGLDRR